MSAADFHKLAALFPDETVTHSYVQDIRSQLPGGSAGTFALITLDNGLDHSKPTTLGPNTLVELGTRPGGPEGTGGPRRDRRRRRHRQAVLPGGRRRPFGREDHSRSASTGSGWPSSATTSTPPWPTWAFPASPSSTALALGGGLEIALQSTYRTVSTGAGALALPEAFIGLVPGWGGVYILPRLIGPENAVKVMIENPLSNNRTLTGPQAYKLGIADALFEPADFVEQSLAWAARVISGDVNAGADERRRRRRSGAVDGPLGSRGRRRPGIRGVQDLQRLPRPGQGPGRHGSQPHHDPGRIRRSSSARPSQV